MVFRSNFQAVIGLGTKKSSAIVRRPTAV